MSEYEIGCVAVGDLSTNCYVVKKKDTGDACVIDPGDNMHVKVDHSFTSHTSLAFLHISSM